jgi:L-threonylcarbamoyladenylate synthase
VTPEQQETPLVDLDEAIAVLRRGGLVAFPTETVYGLGADASNSAAVRRVFTVKRRPPAHPLIVHLGHADWLADWAIEVPAEARQLAERFWPGPLTLILKRHARVHDDVTGGQETVGLRVPGHPLALALLQRFGRGIAAPSANRFGRVSPTTADHVRTDLGTEVDLILDGGPCDVGIESAIVDLSRGVPTLLRPGQLSAEQLEDVIGKPLQRPGASAPRAPGTLESHYAPRTPLEVVAPDKLADRLRATELPVAVLAASQPDSGNVVRFVQASIDADSYARALYEWLRVLDASGASLMLVERPPDAPAWAGIRDRLQRAARMRDTSLS